VPVSDVRVDPGVPWWGSVSGVFLVKKQPLFSHVFFLLVGSSVGLSVSVWPL